MFETTKITTALAAAGLMSIAVLSNEASAATLSATPTTTLSFLADTQQGSERLAVDVTLTNVGDGVQFDLAVNQAVGGTIADLRGFFFDIGGVFGSGYTASGSDVTAFDADENNVNNLRGGVNINGSGQDAFDFGVAFGTPGIGTDDIRSTSFVFALTNGVVSVADFLGQNIAIRGTSTGVEGGAREGSSKTGGTVPTPSVVPLPAAGLLLLFGVGGLGAMRRFRKA